MTEQTDSAMAKNVIILIPDGMGWTQGTDHEYIKLDWTDSAPGATAIFTVTKTLLLCSYLSTVTEKVKHK